MKSTMKFSLATLVLMLSTFTFGWNCPTGQIRQQAPPGTPTTTPFYDVVEGIAFICVPSTPPTTPPSTPSSQTQNQTQQQNQQQNATATSGSNSTSGSILLLVLVLIFRRPSRWPGDRGSTHHPKSLRSITRLKAIWPCLHPQENRKRERKILGAPSRERRRHATS